MPIGPGKYDDICSEVRKRTNARGVVLIIVGGDKGEGFSCQAELQAILRLPEALEAIAAEMRKSII